MSTIPSTSNKLTADVSASNVGSFNNPFLAVDIYASYAAPVTVNSTPVATAVQEALAPSDVGVGTAGPASQANTPNRIVEDFGQGGIGDCWYLAAIKSLSISTLGKASLYSVLGVNATNATVSFQGEKSYTYSTTLTALSAETTNGDTYSADGHSSGDADVLLLEMALKAYTTNASYKNAAFSYTAYSGGWMNQAFSLITGKISNTFNNWTPNLAATTAKLN